MRLLFIFAAILALSLAESEKKYEDLEAAESIELLKTDLDSSASAYNAAPYPQGRWPQNNQDYVPPAAPAQYVPGFAPNPVQSDYVPPQYPPHHHTIVHPPTTTPVSVIKNEHYTGVNGDYSYEYQLSDGTWVREEGKVIPGVNGKEDEVVKKGWYQYKDAYGKVYTVTYWADHTGYHAYGEHLPVPPPIPPAIQASIEQNAKEEAAKAEAEKNKPYTTTRRPIYHDSPQQQYPQPSYPSQQPSYPSQQPSYPSQQPQQTYYPPQQQPQQPYFPPQQPYFPPQQPQQVYYPTQNQ